MTTLARELPSAAPVGGQRRYRQGWMNAADLGGDFVTLPRGGTLNSDVLVWAGFNCGMAWVSSTLGGALNWVVSFMPNRVTDAVISAGGAAVANQVIDFGKGATFGGILNPPAVFIVIQWQNFGAGVLNNFELFTRAKP